MRLPPVIVALDAPTETNAEGEVVLQWPASQNDVSLEWAVLRDEVGIGRTTSVTWRDQPPGSGPWEYRIKAEDDEGREYLGGPARVLLLAGEILLTGPSEVNAEGSVSLSWLLRNLTGRMAPSKWQILRNGELLTSTSAFSFTDRPQGPGPWRYAVNGQGDQDRRYRSNLINVELPPGNIVFIEAPSEVGMEGKTTLLWQVDDTRGRGSPSHWQIQTGEQVIATVEQPSWSVNPRGPGPWQYQVTAFGPQGRPYSSNIVTIELPAGLIQLQAPSEVDKEGKVHLTWRVENLRGRETPTRWEIHVNDKESVAVEGTSWSDQPVGLGPWKYQVLSQGEEGRRYLSRAVVVTSRNGRVEFEVEIVDVIGGGFGSPTVVVDLQWSAIALDPPVQWRILRNGIERGDTIGNVYEDRYFVGCSQGRYVPMLGEILPGPGPERALRWVSAEYQVLGVGPKGQRFQSDVVATKEPEDYFRYDACRRGL